MWARIRAWFSPPPPCTHDDAVAATAQEDVSDRGVTRLRVTQVIWCPRCGWSETNAELV